MRVVWERGKSYEGGEQVGGQVGGVRVDRERDEGG